jgi:hypothetical protein
VLVVGAYFADRENRVPELREEFRRSQRWDVEQRWAVLGDAIPSQFSDVTVAAMRGVPKFALVNRLLRDVDLRDYSYLVICDDDIEVPRNFVDDYLHLVDHHQLSLAQPARTHDSFTDHHFTSQLDGIRARETRFVEIGPVFSIRADAFGVLLPFDEESPMGWGYDFTWPLVVQQAGLKMGIIDAVPVAHNVRKPVNSYSYSSAHAQMTAYLSKRPHLAPHDAFYIVRSHR